MPKSLLPLLILFFAIDCAKCQTFPPSGNLIVNGDFESGFTGWTGTYGLIRPNNYVINPSPLSGTTVGVLDAGQPAMMQTIPTTIGVTYEITLSMRLPDLTGNGTPFEGDSHGNPALITLLWEGHSVDQILVQNRNTWNTFTIDLVAQMSSSTLAFRDPQAYVDANNQILNSASPLMDNISAVAVPEPSAAFVLWVGASLLLPLRIIGGRLSVKQGP